MKTSLFDFSLPDALIATNPAEPRDAARMLVVDDAIRDASVRDLPRFLQPGDLLVFNDTKVIPARLLGHRGGAKVEVLLHKACNPVGRGAAAQDFAGSCAKRLALPQNVYWRCFAKPAKKLKPGDRVDFAADFAAVVEAKLESGEVVLKFPAQDFHAKLAAHGHMPLPPYIAREDNAADRERYQTVYAKREGSVAAPTAGLHFTPALLDALAARGVGHTFVTLHVGGGTFLPVKAEDTADHVMHSEYAEVSAEAARAINGAKGRVVAVGTTSLRTLESAADASGAVRAFSGETDIFITPGYAFKAVDALLTNFHLPKSTLFMLVCAFAGMERMQAAYAHAIAGRYRFYSYGDACLLMRA